MALTCFQIRSSVQKLFRPEITWGCKVSGLRFCILRRGKRVAGLHGYNVSGFEGIEGFERFVGFEMFEEFEKFEVFEEIEMFEGFEEFEAGCGGWFGFEGSRLFQLQPQVIVRKTAFDRWPLS